MLFSLASLEDFTVNAQQLQSLSLLQTRLSTALEEAEEVQERLPQRWNSYVKVLGLCDKLPVLLPKNLINAPPQDRQALTLNFAQHWELFNRLRVLQPQSKVFLHGDDSQSVLTALHHWWRIHYGELEYEWQGSREDFSGYQDPWGLYQKYPEKWLSKADLASDVPAARVQLFYAARRTSSLEAWEGDLALAARLLAPEGNLVITLPEDWWRQETLLVPYLNSFRELYLLKPHATSLYEDRVYLIGLGKLENRERKEGELMTPAVYRAWEKLMLVRADFLERSLANFNRTADWENLTDNQYAESAEWIRWQAVQPLGSSKKL